MEWEVPQTSERAIGNIYSQLDALVIIDLESQSSVSERVNQLAMRLEAATLSASGRLASDTSAFKVCDWGSSNPSTWVANAVRTSGFRLRQSTCMTTALSLLDAPNVGATGRRMAFK